MQRLILASSSPRRKELLENLHLNFEISSSNVDESFDPKLTPPEIVMELAARKARFIAEKQPNAYVIGSDTVVELNGKILGKPQDHHDAYSMLAELSGKTHSVFTGVSIFSPTKETQFYEKTDVTFWELSHEEIEFYIQSGEPFDKAGSYGIQQLGSYFVREIKGDYFAVVGLPVARTVRELKKSGYLFPY
ncbi:Maf family protein [Bacillus sp. B15-48]|uniref:Maf family protein n=1 Tax=Bacillus sp. B15-48 TaxID=1548601 RepID=UPI0019400095|nr:Maf family protein [Bacillus sp. B15-48]MBM4762439.1 septum formation inhibitor Maf [Bacillus sp. B15-48]